MVRAFFKIEKRGCRASKGAYNITTGTLLKQKLRTNKTQWLLLLSRRKINLESIIFFKGVNLNASKNITPISVTTYT